MKILCIIPARGGSKGVPRKNLLDLNGETLLGRTIGHAQASGEVNRIVVSTDDDEIAEEANYCGEEAIMRPAELSTDEAKSEDALIHVLKILLREENYEPDLVVFLQCTSPIRQPNDIDHAIKQLQKESLDSLFSVCKFEGFVWRDEDAQARRVTNRFSEWVRRQDRPQDYLENGSIYILKPWVLALGNSRLGGKYGFYKMHVLDSFQIDTPEDIDTIKSLLKIRGG